MFYINGNSNLPQEEACEELTLNLEHSVNYPSTTCDRYDDPLPVPNSETGSARECQIQRKIIESRKQDVHAEHDQETSGGNG